jgi:hypothetical protein
VLLTTCLSLMIHDVIDLMTFLALQKVTFRTEMSISGAHGSLGTVQPQISKALMEMNSNRTLLFARPFFDGQ